MDCSICADQIRRSLSKLEGVKDIHVDLVASKVSVRYVADTLSRGELAEAIRRSGYRVQKSEGQSSVFIVDGMDCADEIRQIEGKLRSLSGVANLQFDLMRRRLIVDGSISAGDVQHAIKQLGMRARREGGAETGNFLGEARPLGGNADFWNSAGRGRRPDSVARAPSGGRFHSGRLRHRGRLVHWPARTQGCPEWHTRHEFPHDHGGRRRRRHRRMGRGRVRHVFVLCRTDARSLFHGPGAECDQGANGSLAPEATVRRNGNEISVPVDSVLVGETIIIRPGRAFP